MRIIGALGTTYEDGQRIVKQGEVGDCMYIVQKGNVEVIAESPDGEIRLAVLGAGEVFGEMALFTKTPRSATVRASGKARVLSIDRRGFVKRIHEDPSLAFGILRKMSERIGTLNQQVSSLTKLNERSCQAENQDKPAGDQA